MSDLKKGRNQRHERIDMKGRGKWTGWKRWNDGEEVTNGREELKRFETEGTTYREQKGRVETKEVANGITKSWSERKEATKGYEWKGRVATKRRAQWNGRVDRKGRAGTTGQKIWAKRRTQRNEHLYINERKRWMNKMKQWGGSNERSRS